MTYKGGGLGSHHMHNDIDASFGHWSMKLNEEDFVTIPLLIQSYMDLVNVLLILHNIEETPNIKVFFKPYMLKGMARLVGHTKPQQFCFYIWDDDVPAIQFKFLCTSPNWGSKDGILMWHQDNDGKYLLPDGDSKTCKPNLMRIGPKIIKGISVFIEYWKEVCEEDITIRVMGTHEQLIVYWDCIHSTFRALGGNTRMTLTQEFWLQSCLKIVESNIMFFNNGDVHKSSQRTSLTSALGAIGRQRRFVWVLIATNLIWVSYKHEMKRTPNQFGWWKHCLHPILLELTPIFVKLIWNIDVQVPKPKMCPAPI